jgi:hypothetical protein
MRTITVTGGFTGALVFDLRDGLRSLGDAEFRVALAPVGQDDPPPFDTPTWMEATATQTAGSAVVTAVIDSSAAVGYYYAALDIVQDGRHEVAWATDRGTRRRSLVCVT